MGLFLLLFWCSAVMGRCGTRTSLAIIRGSASSIPDWAGANSRFALVREFVGKSLICLTVISTKRRLREQNRRNSRFYGKNREFCPQGAESAVTQPPESGADCPVACRPPLRRQSPFIPVLSEWARALDTVDRPANMQLTRAVLHYYDSWRECALTIGFKAETEQDCCPNGHYLALSC